MKARTDTAFREVLKRAVLVVPESTGLRRYSQSIPPLLEQIHGGDLAFHAVETCAKTGKRVVLFGTSPENRTGAANRLKSHFPDADIRIVEGAYSFHDPDDSRRVLRELDALKPDFAMMAGNEVEAQFWIDHWLINTQANVGLTGSFGQILDVWSGSKPVPPKFFRDRGLGWLLRIPMETPQRRARYLQVLTSFGSMWLMDAIAKRLEQPEPGV